MENILKEFESRIKDSGQFTYSADEVNALINKIKELEDELSKVDKSKNFNPWGNSIEEIKTKFKDLSKYIVDADEAIERFKSLWKKYDTQNDLSTDEYKEMFMYYQRILSLKENGLLTEEQIKNSKISNYDREELEGLITSSRKQSMDRIKSATEEQIELYNKLAQSKKNAAKTSVENNSDNASTVSQSSSIDDITLQKISELSRRIEHAESQITEMQTAISGLGNNDAIDKLKNRVDELSNSLQKSINEIESIYNIIERSDALSLDGIKKHVEEQIKSISDLALEVKKIGDSQRQNSQNIINKGSENTIEQHELSNVDEVVEYEQNKLDELKSKISEDIPKAIDVKNEAFTKEQNHVENVVRNEIESLKSLENAIKNISENSTIELTISNPEIKGNDILEKSTEEESSAIEQKTEAIRENTDATAENIKVESQHSPDYVKSQIEEYERLNSCINSVQKEIDDLHEKIESIRNVTFDVDAWRKKKEIDASKFTDVESLIEKINNKVSEGSHNARYDDYVKQWIGILEYVKRYRELAGDKIDYSAIGGEEIFSKVSSELKNVGNLSIDTSKLRELINLLNSYREEKNNFLKSNPGIAAEDELTERIKQLEVTKRVTAKAKHEVIELYQTYKSNGGEKIISDFTDQKNIISALTSELNKLIDAEKEADIAAREYSESEIKADSTSKTTSSQKQWDALSKLLSSDKYKDIDISKYGELFSKVKSGALSAAEAIREIKTAEEELKEADDDKTDISSDNPIVESQDKIQQELIETRDEAEKTRKSLTELAEIERQQGNIDDYDGNDWNYSRKMLNKHADDIISMQDRISQETDAKILDDLMRDLEDCKISFIALYDCINDSFDGRLDKKGSVKKSTRDLYALLSNEIAQYDEHFIPNSERHKNNVSSNDLQTKSLEDLVQLYHELGTSNGAKEELEKISDAILDIVQAEKELDAYQLIKFFEVLNGLTFKVGDNPILKPPYSVDEALNTLTKLSSNETTNSFIQEPSGQLAMFDGIVESQQKLQEEVKETNGQIDGQIDMFQYLSEQQSKNNVNQNDGSSDNILSEEQALSRLQEALLQTTLAVRNKNSAFEDEAIIVGNSIGQELYRLQELQTAIEKVIETVKELSNIPVKININSESLKDFDTSKLDSISTLKEKISGINIEEINALATALSGLNKRKLGDNLTTLSIGILDLKESLDNLNSGNALNGINELLDKADSLKNLATVLTSSKKEIQEALKQAEKAKEQQPTESKVSSDALKRQADELKGITSAINKIGNLNSDKFTEETISKIGRAQQMFEECEEIVKRIQDEELISDKDLEKVKNIRKEFEDAFKFAGSSDGQTASKASVKNLIAKMNTYLANNSGMSREYKNEILELIKTLENAGKVSKSATTDIAAGFGEVRGKVAEAKQETKSFFDLFTSRVKGMSASALAQYFSLYDIIRYTKEAAQIVKEINTAQTELRKVSTASEYELSKYWETAAENAKKYGAKIDEVINSTADWSRLGYNLSDAAKMADATAILQKVGDNMTQESSSEGMISVLKGFEKSADEAERIVDVINQIANTQPIDTAGLFEGLQRSASSLNAAGNTLEQSAALITTANSVVQDPNAVGVWLCRL